MFAAAGPHRAPRRPRAGFVLFPAVSDSSVSADIDAVVGKGDVRAAACARCVSRARGPPPSPRFSPRPRAFPLPPQCALDVPAGNSIYVMEVPPENWGKEETTTLTVEGGACPAVPFCARAPVFRSARHAHFSPPLPPRRHV